MQITHEEARRFMQFDADQALPPEQKANLSAHLEHCSDCSAYADDINEVSRVLSPLMKRHWALQPLPFSTSSFLRNKRSRLHPGTLLTMRTALISMIVLGVVFGAWQFVISSAVNPGRLPVGVPLIPTPSIQSTSTKHIWENCEMRSYRVRQNDTLASIARQFSISEESILALNTLPSGGVRESTELTIPVCQFTPTGTALEPTLFDTTFTPLTSHPSSTPGG